MQNSCAKLLLIKAGSAVTLINENSETYEFKLLQDLEVEIPCETFYRVEKQGIIHPEES